MRKILTMELLTDKRVKSFRPILEAEASKLMNLIGSEPAGGVVNLSRLLVSVGNAMTSRTAFGKIRGLEGSFLPVIHRIRIIDEHVSRRRNRETEHLDKAVATGGEEEEDLVDVLLACTDNHLEVKAVILGGDTSPVTVEWAMSELMKNPEKMNKVQREVREMFDKRGKVVDDACFNELHYLKSVVKETFRLHPPVPLSIPREGRETVVINGCQIPAKTRIIVNSWAIGRNSSHWTQPDQFIPERFLNSSIDYKGNDFQLIPFGAGRRMCPGMNYGIFVVYLLLANLLYHFDWKLPNQIKPQDLDMSEDSGGTVPRKNNLYLNSIPYHAP
ncbi:unnamed protein product [Linum tenue]|uniref:Cytochrome P450 n=1 Tax=Linum tenue TaxID=586396 RepID=A0AAV0L2F3_9ROSI|nr:unnamed protein product [Linum tenue]